MSETARLRGRPVTNEEAMDAAMRFINEHFKNGSARPDTRIPAQVTDSDIVLMDYLRESAALQARIATLEQERDIANKLVEAEQRAEAVVSWLRENAVHADHCLMYDTWNSDAPECNCGFDAVLRGTPALTAPRPAADGTAHENQREES